MKKNENDNLVSHFHSLCEEKKLKDEIAKQQKRLWLRTKIHEIIGMPEKSTFEEIFNWIYQASIYEWEGMLYCFKYAAKSRIHWGEYDEALKDAKELYSVLK
jgi:hypothetical protein